MKYRITPVSPFDNSLRFVKLSFCLPWLFSFHFKMNIAQIVQSGIRNTWLCTSCCSIRHLSATQSRSNAATQSRSNGYPEPFERLTGTVRTANYCLQSRSKLRTAYPKPTPPCIVIIISVFISMNAFIKTRFRSHFRPIKPRIKHCFLFLHVKIKTLLDTRAEAVCFRN